MSDESTPRRKIQPEMVVGVSAVFIGVCALVVSLYEAKLMREEQRSAVLPLVELSRSHYVNPNEGDTAKWRLSLQAQNVGIGPARVMDFRVMVDGEAYPTWREAMQALIGPDVDVRYGQSTINGRTIPPERLVTMFDLSNTEHAGAIIREFDRLDYEACFCSVFDECWTTSYSAFGAAQPIANCNRDDGSFME